MKMLMLDIDTLRADHLGCYGYSRDTSPAIDSIARDGVVFTDYYCSDAPCLPSRAALFTGRFGIHSGVVNHGGLAADMRLEGETRGFRDARAVSNLPALLRLYGMHTVSVSTFPERHGAWWFNAGFNETYNLGLGGDETAQQVAPIATDWLERNKDRQDWFLHVHMWDPHTDYRAPAAMGNPFEGQDSEAISWIDQETLDLHRRLTGFHSAREVNGFTDRENPLFPRQLGKIESLEDVRRNVDGYDCGILNADHGVLEILDKLKQLDVYEETVIVVTSDHGEDLGELGRYDEHGCADYPVTRIPLVVKWPGCAQGARCAGLRYNVDFIPTMVELLGDFTHIPYEHHLEQRMGPHYKRIFSQMLLSDCDGRSFADAIKSGVDEKGYEYLVLSVATHSVQRSVRFGDYLYMRTYHDGYCLFDEDMLFNVKDDPHETKNLAGLEKDKVFEGAYLLQKWVAGQMEGMASKCTVDPIWTVIGEGGASHVKGQLPAYLQRLEETQRGAQAAQLREKYKMR